MIIGLVRHGESDGNVNNVLSSSRQDKVHLTKLGREQISALREDPFLMQPLDCVYVSPFPRTLESATALSNTLNGAQPPLIVDPRIAEENYGHYSGSSLDATRESLNETFRRITKGDHLIRMGVVGENRREFLLRVYSFLVDILERHNNDHNVLVITHSSVISDLEKLWIRLYQPSFVRESTKNGQLKRLSIEKDEVTLIKTEVEKLLFEPDYQDSKLMKYVNDQLLTFSPTVERVDSLPALLYSLQTRRFYRSEDQDTITNDLWLSGVLYVNHTSKDIQNSYQVLVQQEDVQDGKEIELSSYLEFVASYNDKFYPRSNL